MLKYNLLPSIDETLLKDEDNRKRQEDILSAHAEGWVKDLLVVFQKHLYKVQDRYRTRGWVGKRERFPSRTLTSAFKTASLFLASISSSCLSVQHIDQTDLEHFIVINPGYENSLRFFIRFINNTQKLFKKLHLPSVYRNLPGDIFLPHERYQSLLGEWLDAKDDTLKEAIICLLMLLYGQIVKKIVRLKVADFNKAQDGCFLIIFGKAEIPIDKTVSAMLDRYFVIRKALSPMEEEWENQYLFPGRRRGEHLSEGSVAYYLKRYSVTAENLFSSAILYAYLNGITLPKMLVKAFGITDATAIKYMMIINPRVRDEMEETVQGQIANG